MLITLGSLFFWSSRQVTPPPMPAGQSRFPVTLDPDRMQHLPAVYDASNRSCQFTLVFTNGALDAVAGIAGRLDHDQPIPACTIQAVVEGNHRGSYGRILATSLPDQQPFTFLLPLDDRPDDWQALDHPGTWSGWETAGLRALRLKVFAPDNLPPNLTFQWTPILRDPKPPLPSLAWIHPLAGTIPAHHRFELAFDITPRQGNPFHIAAVGITMTVTGPDGSNWTVRPFLYEPYTLVITPDGERILPQGAKHWRARFRPPRPGSYTYSLDATVPAAPAVRRLAEGSFTVLPGKPADMLRISSRNPRYFEKPDGSFYYPIGWNIAYPSDNPYDIAYTPYLPEHQTLSGMFNMLDDLADSGGTFIRFWVSDWFNGLEWNRDLDHYLGLGRYNLKNAWMIDQILDHCERRGIHVLFTTLNHVRLTHHMSWRTNPYQVRRGGFLHHPLQFWSDPRVKTLSEQRLTYLVARWADSPSIHSWNFMSEFDLVSFPHAWHPARQLVTSQLRWIGDLDPYRHIRANHLCYYNRDFSFYERPEIEFIHANAYPDVVGLPADQPAAIRRFAEQLSAFAKPVLATEYGGHWAADPAHKMRRDIINGLWAGICSDLSGAPLSWWWNFHYGESLGRYFRIAADFMTGEDLIAADTPEQGGWKHRIVQTKSRDGNLDVLMVGNRRKRFIYAFNYETICRSLSVPTVCTNAAFRFDSMTPGSYVAELWDTETGPTTPLIPLTVATDGTALLNLPAFTRDWAIKIMPADTTRPPLPLPLPDRPFDPIPPKPASPLELSWRIIPLVTNIHPAAMSRTVQEMSIALPPNQEGTHPSITGADPLHPPCQWEWADYPRAWRIRIPATARGPFTITAIPSNSPAVNPKWHFDERQLGLEVQMVPWTNGILMTHQTMVHAWSTITNPRTARVAMIDHLENPAGREADNFLCRYHGPLLIPAGGSYGFAINSDDGSSLALNHQPMVSWTGHHNPNMVDRPLYNAWNPQNTSNLTAGVYAVEYFHQDFEGYQMARVGWQPPAGFDGPASLLPAAFNPTTPDWAVIPPWALDGRIPCRLEIVAGTNTLLTLHPSQGLELRRPEHRIPVLLIEKPGSNPWFQAFDSMGWQTVAAHQDRIPVWAENSSYQRFSLEIEHGISDTGSVFIRTRTFDINLPLSLNVDGTRLAPRDHRPRQWVMWHPEPLPGYAWATLELQDHIPLLDHKITQPPQIVEPVVPLPSGTRLPSRLAIIGDLQVPMNLPNPARFSRSTGMITAQPLPFDIGSSTPADLIRTLNTRGPDEGVVFPLDRGAWVRGITGPALIRQWAPFIQALIEQERIPVLVITRDIDVHDPLARRQAFALLELQQQFNCPLLDLREIAKP